MAIFGEIAFILPIEWCPCGLTTDLQFSWERWQRADHYHLSRDHRMALV